MGVAVLFRGESSCNGGVFGVVGEGVGAIEGRGEYGKCLHVEVEGEVGGCMVDVDGPGVDGGSVVMEADGVCGMLVGGWWEEEGVAPSWG